MANLSVWRFAGPIMLGLAAIAGAQNSEQDDRVLEWFQQSAPLALRHQIPEGLPPSSQQVAVMRCIVEWNPHEASAEVQGGLLSHVEELLLRDAPRGELASFTILAAGTVCGERLKPYLAEIVERDCWEPLAERGERTPWTLSSFSFVGSMTWAAMRASARVYQSEDVSRCIQIVDKEAADDYERVQLADRYLRYIERPEVVDYLVPLLSSSATRNLPDSPIVIQAGHSASLAAHVLEQMIPPLKADAEAYFSSVENRSNGPLSREARLDYYRNWLSHRERWVPAMERP